MEAAKLLDAFGSQPGFSKAQADAIQKLRRMPFKLTSRPSSLVCPHGSHFRETVGPNIGAKSFGNLLFHWFWHYMGTPTVEVFCKTT